MHQRQQNVLNLSDNTFSNHNSLLNSIKSIRCPGDEMALILAHCGKKDVTVDAILSYLAMKRYGKCDSMAFDMRLPRSIQSELKVCDNIET